MLDPNEESRRRSEPASPAGVRGGPPLRAGSWLTDRWEAVERPLLEPSPMATPATADPTGRWGSRVVRLRTVCTVVAVRRPSFFPSSRPGVTPPTRWRRVEPFAAADQGAVDTIRLDLFEDCATSIVDQCDDPVRFIVAQAGGRAGSPQGNLSMCARWICCFGRDVGGRDASSSRRAVRRLRPPSCQVGATAAVVSPSSRSPGTVGRLASRWRVWVWSGAARSWTTRVGRQPAPSHLVVRNGRMV